jgi:hypothetical protein
MLAPREDWLPIAEQASKEMDPEKLMILVEQLCCALDNRRGPANAYPASADCATTEGQP